jgi:hypothetical protein
MSLLQSSLTVLRRELSASSDGIPKTAGNGSTTKKRHNKEKKDCAYDRAFKSNGWGYCHGRSFLFHFDGASNQQT